MLYVYDHMFMIILASLQFGHSLQTLLLYRPQIGSDIEWRKSDSLIASLFERIFFRIPTGCCAAVTGFRVSSAVSELLVKIC